MEKLTPDFMLKIDWKLLREQKQLILDLSIGGYNIKEIELLEGLVGLIDNIQDSAVDEYGFEEGDVFEFKDEE